MSDRNPQKAPLPQSPAASSEPRPGPPPLGDAYFVSSTREELIRKIETNPAGREEFIRWLRSKECGVPPTPEQLRDAELTAQNESRYYGDPPRDAHAMFKRMLGNSATRDIIDEVAKKTGITVQCDSPDICWNATPPSGVSAGAAPGKKRGISERG